MVGLELLAFGNNCVSCIQSHDSKLIWCTWSLHHPFCSSRALHKEWNPSLVTAPEHRIWNYGIDGTLEHRVNDILWLVTIRVYSLMFIPLNLQNLNPWSLVYPSQASVDATKQSPWPNPPTSDRTAAGATEGPGTITQVQLQRRTVRGQASEIVTSKSLGQR